jgi:hypothetical protein
MKKNEYAPYILIFYIILIAILLFTSCVAVEHTVSKIFPSKSAVCPSNDSRFFFRQAGVKPTKQYLRNNRN